MTALFKKLGLAALVTVAAAVGGMSTANAGGDFGWGVYIGGGPGPGYDRDYRHGDREWGHGRRHHRPEFCAPGHAVEKARWNGLRRAHVQDVTPRRVVVGGFRHGGFDRMVFANVRGCPVIRY
ncbi:hypothetical protein HHL25_02870 [Rhizobium sp. S-51]|uniref:Sulfur globule protein n=1 Tax=Rhizobium terricola TaxID=2728849 RepID=A0A7Y0FU64_9HYPH|nr:hypothetical protein [Rhizobium terricola]NML73062.1 hypothetical protein [Rhizobium terricola]